MDITIILEEEQEQELAVGGNDDMGGGAMEERVVGTVAIVDQGSMMAVPTSSIPEVQGAVAHALCVFLGLSPPTKAILIRPLPALSDPPPAPSAEVTWPFSRMARKPLQQEPAPLAMTPLCRKQPARSSSRPTGPALGSGQGARPKVSQAPAPAPPTGGRCEVPVVFNGCSTWHALGTAKTVTCVP